MQDEATVTCPYCGQENVIGLDWGGAAHQDYEEDCQVCCRPWRVQVTLDPDLEAQVSLDRLEE